MKKKIVFVCTGNTCRSPMAEAAANSLFALKGLEASYRAQSRGICAAEGACASPGCVYACGLHGLDVSQHVSRQFGAQDADDAALILTMAKEHKAKLCALFPKNRQKIYTLSEFVAIIEKKDEIYVKDIGDPFGMPFSVYEAVFLQINDLILRLADYLKSEEIS